VLCYFELGVTTNVELPKVPAGTATVSFYGVAGLLTFPVGSVVLFGGVKVLGVTLSLMSFFTRLGGRGLGSGRGS